MSNSGNMIKTTTIVLSLPTLHIQSKDLTIQSYGKILCYSFGLGLSPIYLNMCSMNLMCNIVTKKIHNL